MKFFELKKTKSPLELYSIANQGADANIVQRLLGPLMAEEKDFIQTQIVTAQPDAMAYARLAGRLDTVLKIEKILELKAMEGQEARDILNGRK